MRWKLLYNIVAITILAGSHGQANNNNKSSEKRSVRRPILHTPGQHFPSPAELLQGYVPPKETEKPITYAPTSEPHEVPSLVEERNPLISVDKDEPDFYNNETPIFPPVQITTENNPTTTANNYRTPRQLNFDSTTPSVTTTSTSEPVFASVNESGQVSSNDSDFVKLPTPHSPPLPSLAPLPTSPSSPPLGLPPYSKPNPLHSIPSPTYLSSSSQSPPLLIPYADHYITSPESTVSPRTVVPSTPSRSNNLTPVRYPPSPRIPPPRLPASPNSNPYSYSTFNNPIPTSGINLTPTTSKYITHQNQHQPSPPPRLLLPPSTSSTVYITSEVYNAKSNQNYGIYSPAAESSLQNTPLPYEPVKYPNHLHPSLPPRISPNSKPALPVSTPPLSHSDHVTHTFSNITTSQPSSHLQSRSLPLQSQTESSKNPPTPIILPSYVKVTPNPTISTSNLITTPEPPSTIAPTIPPSSLPPSLLLQSEATPQQSTSEINTLKPNVTIVYPDQSIIIPPSNTSSVTHSTSENIPVEKHKPEPNISLSTVAPICVQRYAYYKAEGSSDSYYECQDYRLTQKRCQEGYYYNPKLEWPKYPCDAKEVKQGEITSEYGPIPSPNGNDKYRMVVNGYYYEMTCPQGLSFNPIEARCDWPVQVSRNSDVSLGFNCPSEGVDESGNPIVTNYKYDGSCNLFYSCQAGYARLLSCRPGNAFNTLTGRCEKAEQVVCDNNNFIKF